MGKLDRRSRDQKRKAKLKKRLDRSHKHESLAYHGQKYRAEEYVGIMHRTELGIYETFVMSDRTLTDDAVESALEQLVLRLRQGPLSRPDATSTDADGGEATDDLISWNIRRNWQSFEEKQPLPKREDLIGVLRTILRSLEIWRSMSMHSQGYLRFLEGFMKQTGVTVQRLGSHLEPISAPEEDPLLALGRDWISDADEEAAEQFAEEVEASLQSGDGERVLEVCQQLLGETRDVSFVPILEAFALRGHQALERQIGSSTAPDGGSRGLADDRS